MSQSLYDISVTNSRGKELKLAEYEGDVLLIVNVASACGFTPQYEGLEELHKAYSSQGLRVLAFPCNDFGAQEPGSMEEIESFCSLNYGVTFDLFQKIAILGENRHPLYTWLINQAEPAGEDVKWNFEKFLLGRDGKLIGRYSSKIAPEDESLVSAVENALA